MVLRNRGFGLCCKTRGSSFKDLGVWRLGNMARLGHGASPCRSYYRKQSPVPAPEMHVPIPMRSFPPGISPRCGASFGNYAGFCEEVLFRAFLMTEFAEAGYGKVIQVLMPALRLD